MKITLHNDGKEKDMSFQASVYIGDLTGFGKDKGDALIELGAKLKELEVKIGHSMKHGFTDIIDVDCVGNPIKERK